MRGSLLAFLCAASWQTAAAYEPQINYMLNCMGCHTPDGSGEPGRVPDMKPTLAPFAASPDGRRYLVQVPGASQSALTNAELADLLNWMIQNLSLTKPGHFTHYTEAEVASYRSKTLVAVKATRERLMQSLIGASAPKP